MKREFNVAALVLALGIGMASAQITPDVLGAHDMSPASGAPVTGTLGSPCQYCHAPHSGINGTPGIQGTPLWSQKLSSVPTYQMYTSPTMVNKTNASPPLGSNSTLCLSCHDGTVALGMLTPYGQVSMTVANLANTTGGLGTNLSSMHPFSFMTPIQTSPDLNPSLSAVPPSTQDPTGVVKLINGNVECGSCHNPHVQNIDASGQFLVIDNSQSALCLACHSTVPTGTGMGLNTVPAATPKTAPARAGSSGVAIVRQNPLGEWRNSIHAIAPNRVTDRTLESYQLARRIGGRAMLGSYTTVRKNGCLSCHTTHNATPDSLLRAPDDQACINCHNGGSNVSPAAPNVFSEMASPKVGHSFATAKTSGSHSVHESELLNQNRHATCVDCHNPHATKQVGLNFAAAPAIRGSQEGVAGISATDGQSVVYPAKNQYENCLRCHGASTGKASNSAVFGYLPIRTVSAADPLNVFPQFNSTSASSHPVMHDRSSPFPQPSLRLSMLNLDGSKTGRGMGVRILCTDCHNSDDNREFGGTGPNGPHGSKYFHILERRYDMSQSAMPGQPITNLNIPPNLSTVGNYALCAKCHDLANIVSNASFTEHARHINDGFSCSTCHTAHGMTSQAGMFVGERMVNFDLNVVAPNGTAPISYRRVTNSCSLTCHGHPHSLAGNLAGGAQARPR